MRPLFWLSCCLAFVRCTAEEPVVSGNRNSGDWLIPIDEVVDTGSGKSGIPALNFPRKIRPVQAEYLSNEDSVIGVLINNTPLAYPEIILNWHEIINDSVNGFHFSVTHSPLSGVSRVYSRSAGNRLANAGLVYRQNLIFYDESTNTNWLQYTGQAINGEQLGRALTPVSFLKTRWDTWQSLYPDTEVITSETGYQRNYNRYPYGNYRNADYFFYRSTFTDTLLPPKTQVVGLSTERSSKAYVAADLSTSAEVMVDTIRDTPVLFYASRARQLYAAFQLSGLPASSYTPVSDELPVIVTDTLGNRINFSGQVVTGPDIGTELQPVATEKTFWFTWQQFNPETRLEE